MTIPGSSYADRKGRFMSHLVTRRNAGEAPGAGHKNGPIATLAADPTTAVFDDPKNVIPSYLDPSAAQEWRATINEFGMMMLNPLTEISIMLAKGLGLPSDYFTRLMHEGHHKVAPTFASLYHDRKPGTVLAALHEDIDVFAIHTQGTHSGLFVYTDTGVRLQVAVPEGCYLVQAGRQLYLKMRSMERTGEIDHAPIYSGWHEVIVTQDAVDKARPAIEQIDAIVADGTQEPEEKLARIRPLIKQCLRISSTFFYHFGDDTELVYGLPEGSLEEDTFPEGTKIQRYIGLELGFIKLRSTGE